MKKSYVFLVIVLALIIAGGIVVDHITTTRPEWPAGREGDASPARPQPDDPPFHRVPMAETFEERRQMYFDWLLGQETPDSKGVCGSTSASWRLERIAFRH